jgi:hypothetical protein
LLGVFLEPADWGDMFPEMSVDFQQTTQNYNPEDRTIPTGVEFEVLTVVVIKSSTFWDIMLHSPLKVNWLQCVISQKIVLFNRSKLWKITFHSAYHSGF